MEIIAASYLYPVTAAPMAGGALVTDLGRIIDAGPLAEMRQIYNAPCREFPGCVIMPGLVNPHTHLELTHFPSWKLRKGIDYLPRTYVDWVIQVIKIKRALTRPELENSVREGIRVSLESGTTALGDVVTDRTVVPLYAQIPISGRLFFEAIGQDPAGCRQLLADLDAALAAFPDGRLRPGLSPHSSHTLSPGFIGEIAALAGRYSVPMAVHLSESREESSFLHDSTGGIADLLYPFVGWEASIPAPQRTTPTAWLDARGALGPTTTVIHCVHVTPADVALLRERSVVAVLCPRSNERLDVGRAPAALLKKAGIPLALGTDSLASNDSLSLWDEMRFLRRQFPGLFTPEELLEMVTINAALALRLDSEIGSLERGKRADFLVLRMPQTTSAAGLPEALVEESQLEEVFISGAPAE